jgi:uncharacterized protein YyaL (SSP411 family)
MNTLGTATSPYLLQHKDNPVNWHAWGPEAFAESEATGKPILLSIGYTACHWCHVMNRESFSDADTAALMNELFVNVKVDKEERPDVDQLYQAAANTLGHAGGWPLTMFINAKGVPFFAGAYFPPEERFNTPAFKTILNDVARLYRDQGESVIQNGNNVVASLNQMWNRDARANIDNQFLENSAFRIGQRFDIFFGGMIGPMKFPNASFIEVLWRAHLRSGIPQFAQLAMKTLDVIVLGGIHDHIGGGFFRYCTDEHWMVPHFEKMLSDNAMLIDYMTLIWQWNRNKPCQDAVKDTIDWMLREMKVGGAFASSLDADSEGEEGKYYLWTEAEIDAALAGTFVQRFKTIYNVRREGQVHGKNALHRISATVPYPLPEADEALLVRQRELLLAARQKRVPPQRDDKVLADWNGLAITALANAGAAFQNNSWISAATAAFDFVVKTLGEGDRLYHSWRDGKRGVGGFADDYANMARAALALWEATSDKRFVDMAKRWTNTLNTLFWDTQLGGYHFTSEDSASLVVRSRMVFDQPTPPANSQMMGVLARLHLITGEQQYFERAQALGIAFAGEAQRAGNSMPSYFNNIEFVSLAAQIVVIGANDNPKTHELTQAVYGRSFPNRLLTVVSPGEALPEGHPAHGKTMQNGVPTAYICQRNTCSPPITNPVQLSQILQLPRQAPAAPQTPPAT